MFLSGTFIVLIEIKPQQLFKVMLKDGDKSPGLRANIQGSK